MGINPTGIRSWGVNRVRKIMTKSDLLNIDVKPFTRLVWNSENARRTYGHILHLAASIHDKAEYEMVRQEKRKCGTLHLAPHNFHILTERLRKDGMVWLPIQWSKSYTGFSHYHLPTTAGDPNSSCYGVMAKNTEDAEAFRTASAYNGRNAGKVDHEVIGELLGFPACCTKFFTEKWGNGFYDPVWQSAVAAKHQVVDNGVLEVEGNIHTNQMLRYYGFRTTSHFPCSLNCVPTIEVGEVWLEVMKRLDSSATELLVEILELPLIWSTLHGIAVVETPLFTLITNSLPAKEKWTVMHNVPGGIKPCDVLKLPTADIDYDKLTAVMIEQLKWGV